MATSHAPASVGDQVRMTPRRLVRARTEIWRLTRRIHLIKIVCGIVLGICYWYSVPYTLPFIVQDYPDKAVSAEAVLYEGSASRQIAMPIIAFVCLVLLRELPQRGRFTPRMRLFVAAYVGWAILSIIWSDNPSLSLKRLVVFLINALVIYTFATRISMLETATLGFLVTGAVALIGLYGDTVMQHIFDPRNPDYRFQGVAEANYQAMSIVVGIFSGLTLFDRKPRWRLFLGPALLAAFILLYITRSRVSTITCLMMVAIMVLRLVRRNLQVQARAMFLVAALMVIVPTFVYIVGQSGADAAQAAFMMGRTDTQNTSNLSNRAPLWAELSEYVASRPLQGFGYAGFWSSDRVSLISKHQGWTVPHAHETYIDQVLSLGVVGALLYAGVLWSSIFISWKRYRRTHSATDLMAAALLSWLAMEGLAESVPIDPYLPTTLAYACILRMCLAEGSDESEDIWLGPHEIINGVTPGVLARLPSSLRAEAHAAIEQTRA